VSKKVVVSSSAVTPPLKWAGGKRWLLPSLKPIWQPHRRRRLVEPFCGGLAVALGLQPDQALLNDVNPHLINFYRWLKQGLALEIPLVNDEALFYSHRTRFNELIQNGESQSQEAAALFYYLNRTCFNGLCRFNQKGGFNVPFGSYKRINYTEDFSAYSEVLAEWEFTCQDFEQLTVAEDDFIYADPPYDVEFRQYSKDGFPWEDQVRLAQWLVTHPGPVVLSNQATERIVELYEDLRFNVKYLEAPRRISCTGDRTPAREVLAIRNIREIERLGD
jgi:DNA adenine methylase